ncbi:MULTISPECIES: TIGR00341 family protein [unclassified Candidatus Frackibacter]|uniref:TIGR00341 family protein n=1 Tax=unclassified Candidatus Frackibacter TaxID=2648818 RepID=UPI000887214C|nr:MULTISPECIES: TIGR00341 family protein [unclassified Candidatus Frackibacter]SDC24143.1 TIGR00341 family protein [Candidatus Frackibacter sp. WG11]SEM47872.1 TIGR00341 family protein [Candidatus Frackibacter sp. WG12]SFL49874.1 TIGR00341 family protein [Candidatus Frackibacter sp. WG13]
MQVVQATFRPGEGKEAIELLETLGLDIKDYKLITSETGDLLIINLLYGNTDVVLDNLSEHFNFEEDDDRSMVIFTPDTIIPRDKDKIEESSFKANRESLVTYAQNNSTINDHFIFLAIMAAIIASMGLILDNTPVIVGSMIIAPVFGPIVAIAMGIVLGDFKLMGKGIMSETAVLLIAVIIGLLMGAITPNIAITNALRVRMFPTVADILVALAAGGAGAYSLISGVRAQIVGVVIAAALIPVMCTVGIGISLLNLSMVGGALLLLGGNYLALILAIIGVFYFKGLKPQIWYKFKAEKLIKKSLTLIIAAVIILSLPLSWITYQRMIKEKPEEIVRKIYRDSFGDELETDLLRIQVTGNEVELFIYTPQGTNEHFFELLEKRIRRKLGPDVRIYFEVVQTKRFQLPLD